MKKLHREKVTAIVNGKRKNPDKFKLLLQIHFIRLVGPINTETELIKRIALEDETAKLIKNKMREAWNDAIKYGTNGTSFEEYFSKTDP